MESGSQYFRHEGRALRSMDVVILCLDVPDANQTAAEQLLRRRISPAGISARKFGSWLSSLP